ncbi:BrnT family toxin [Rhodopila sp.]|uniref:BrnT family toxin n=1 Tax=Rhodopila sp. TaxID=2480087 RepID=UPI003D10C706
MEISFDPVKDAANTQERGIPLAFAAVVLAHAVGEIEDIRKDYGEVRQRAFGEVEGRWFQCVYTLRGKVRHIITVHRIEERRVKRWLNLCGRR